MNYPEMMNRHRETAIIILLSGFAVILMFFPALFLNARSIQWDSLDLHYPHLAFFSRNVQTGIVPLWEPHLFCGYPFAGYLQSGAFFPVNFALALLHAITPRLVILLTIFSYFLAFAGLWMLVRRLGLSMAAGAMAGISWAFSGQMLGHAMHLGIIQIHSVFPWVLWLASGSRKGSRLKHICASALLMGWSILAGHFQSAMYCSAFWLIWILLGIGDPTREAHSGYTARISRRFGLMLTAAILCGTAAGIQLFATADLALQTHRSSISTALSQSENLYPASLMTIFIPDVYGGISGDYSGAWSRTNQQCHAGLAAPLLWAASLLCLLGIPRRTCSRPALPDSRTVSLPVNSSNATLLRFLTLWIVIGTLFAFGPLTPVHQWVVQIAPGWNLVRTPSALMPLVFMALAIMAGFGLDRLSSVCSGIMVPSIRYGIPLLTLLQLVLLYRSSDLMFGKTHPYAHFQQTPQREFLDERYREDPRSFRIHEWDIREVLLTNEASWKGWYGTGGRISGLHLKNLGTLLRLTIFKRDILDILRVKYVLTGDKKTAAFIESTVKIPRHADSWDPRALLEQVSDGIYFNRASRPLVFPVTEWEICIDSDERVNRLLDVNLNSRVILEEDPGIPCREIQAGLTLDDIRYDLHRVDFRYRLDVPALLVMGDTWTADWKATIDDKPVKLMRADHALRAIAAPAGDHIVRMDYEPFSYKIGLYVWLLSFCSAGFLLISFPGSNSSQKCHKPGS